MGRFVFVAAIGLAGAAVIGLTFRSDEPAPSEPARYVRAEPAATTVMLDAKATGSALATAAFGLSALQPETFNPEIVRDIIEAAPLDNGEKDRLTAKLSAAIAGHADLPHVLSDIRTTLAVE